MICDQHTTLSLSSRLCPHQTQGFANHRVEQRQVLERVVVEITESPIRVAKLLLLLLVEFLTTVPSLSAIKMQHPGRAH